MPVTSYDNQGNNKRYMHYILHIWKFHYSDCPAVLWKAIVPSYLSLLNFSLSPKKNTKPCEPGGHSSCASRDCCSCTYRPLSICCKFIKHLIMCWCGTDGNEIIYQHPPPLFPYVWRHRPVHHIWRSVCILQVKSLPKSPLPFTHPPPLSLSLHFSFFFTLYFDLQCASRVFFAPDFLGD